MCKPYFLQYHLKCFASIVISNASLLIHIKDVYSISLRCMLSMMVLTLLLFAISIFFFASSEIVSVLTIDADYKTN